MFNFRDMKRFRVQTEDYRQMCQRMVALSSSGDSGTGGHQDKVLCFYAHGKLLLLFTFISCYSLLSSSLAVLMLHVTVSFHSGYF